MAVTGSKGWGLSLRLIGATLTASLSIASMVAITEARLKEQVSGVHAISPQVEPGLFMRVLNFLWQKGEFGYTHVWPVSPRLYLTTYVFWDSHVGSSLILLLLPVLLLRKSS